VPVLSDIARRLSAQFIPLAALPLPAAILFRGYELLFVGETQLELGGDFTQYLVVISLPLLTLVVTWKTFRYASPLAARVIGGAGRSAVYVGSITSAGYLAGPKAAEAAARWGPKAAVGSSLARRHSRPTRADSEPQGESDHSGSVPEYRRSENDPGDHR
jgi:type IV secretion system protein TrbL